jgi:SagB-type dehydrogenase family enzyme
LPIQKGDKFCLNKDVPPSTLGALAATRRTTYKFGDKPFSFAQLCCLFWSMYGHQGSYDERLSRRTYTIPSGGGLYGLRFDVFLFQDIEKMAKGHYLWRPTDCGFEFISADYMPEISENLFNPKIDLNKATGAFVISADLNRSSRNYSSSCFPLSYFEAGHAFQNGYLFASQENFGIAEILGFRRRLVEQIISDEKYSYYSLICGLFGSRPTE